MRHQHPGPFCEGLNDVADNRYQLQLAWILAQVGDFTAELEQLAPALAEAGPASYGVNYQG